MYKNAKPLFLICETPLHAGSGSDLGIVDLPIQRERHTGFPKIEGSSLKGAIRESFETVSFEGDDEYLKFRKQIHRAYGFDGDSVYNRRNKKENRKHRETIESYFGEHTQFSGALAISDARLLLFPVKSLHGVFAWITCPRVIRKFKEDLKLAGISTDFNVPSPSTTSGTAIYDTENNIQLEEYIFHGKSGDKNGMTPNDETSKLANWLAENLFKGDQHKELQNHVKECLVVLEDTDFRDFTLLSTEVITRTKINNHTGTVQQGALFSEEYLPMESVLYSLVMFSDEFAKEEEQRYENKMTQSDVKEFFKKGLEKNDNIVQVGANANLGKGIIKTVFLNA